MRILVLTLFIIALMAATNTTAYPQEYYEKSQNGQDSLQKYPMSIVESTLDLEEAQNDCPSEYEKFRKESEVKIRCNETSIADLSMKFVKRNRKDQAIYQNQIDELEQKNDYLRTELINYKDERHENLMSFRKKFNRDMDGLIKALNNFKGNK